MTRRHSTALTALVAILAVSAGVYLHAQTTASAPAGADLRVIKTFMGDGNDRWDYLTVDSNARRVYVARATHVEVFDADTGAVLGQVADTPGVHGIALAPEHNLGFASNGKDNSISAFDLTSLKTVQKIPAGTKPDAIVYDPSSKLVFACNGGSGDMTLVDPANLGRAPVTLAIGGKLEYAVADGAGRVFVNVEDKGEVVAIDSNGPKIVNRWPVAPGEEPSGLAMDVEHHRLFVGCGNQKMIVLDADSGNVLAALPIGPGVDGVAFDAKLGLAMSANGKDGTVTAVREGPKGTFTVVQNLKTVRTARTIANDPRTHQAYLPCMVPGQREGQTTFGLLVIGAPR